MKLLYELRQGEVATVNEMAKHLSTSVDMIEFLLRDLERMQYLKPHNSSSDSSCGGGCGGCKSCPTSLGKTDTWLITEKGLEALKRKDRSSSA